MTDDLFNKEPPKVELKSEKAFSDFKESSHELELQIQILNEILTQLDKEQLNNLSSLLLQIKEKSNE